MTNIETYKEKLQQLIIQNHVKTIVVQILDILESSINKTLSINEDEVEQGIEELIEFRKMWGKEYDVATFFIAYAYEIKFYKDTSKNMGELAISEYEKVLSTGDYEHIRENIKVLRKKISK